MLQFRSYTNDTVLAELLYISIETRPEISTVNKFQYFVLTEVTSKNMIMTILENTYTEITSRQYITSVINTKKTISIYRLLAICRNISYSD